MKAIIIEKPGDTSVLKYVDIPIPEVRDDDVLVKVTATALNRVDILQRQGVFVPSSDASPIMGIEVAGQIVKKGKNVSQFAVGDCVFGFVNGGGYAQYCLLDSQSAFLTPDNWVDTYAVAIPEAFITAAERLYTNGNLQANQSVLIHAAGSGVGTATIQLAKYSGAYIFVTAGSDEKIKKCLALGADVGINYKKEDFVKIISDKTGGNGVDLIIDSIGADYLMRNQQALKFDGKLILIGLLGGGIQGNLDILQLIY